MEKRLIFHVYNQSNDRKAIFHEDQNYRLFLSKVVRQIKPVSTLLGYCIMPNHFHLLVSPHHLVIDGYDLTGKSVEGMPTVQLGQAMKSLQMGYAKSYNKFYGTTGSRFRQRSKSKFRLTNLDGLLTYLHDNPVKAGLVSDPSEWGYSSNNEYSGLLNPADCLCDVTLGRQILQFQTT